MIATAQYAPVTSRADSVESIPLQCPRCRGRIADLPHTTFADTVLVCSDCCFKLVCDEGIWKSLLPERTDHFCRFIKDYEFIRSAEGRGSTAAEYYLALPYQDLSGHNTPQWAMRSKTFRYMQRNIIPDNRSGSKKRLRILDLGAGNGWMSYRLALLGHAPVAVDLLTNSQDGLGAATHYRKQLSTLFPRFQAELDMLPFADGTFDLVIYNASFHYSEDYEKTLAEALRCTRAGGSVIISDTPWYSSESSGQQMIAERRKAFTQRFGFPSDGLKSLEFLTDQRLQKMEASFGISWRRHTPNYGVRWLMRPLLAKIQRNREPSQFRIYTAKVGK